MAEIALETARIQRQRARTKVRSARSARVSRPRERWRSGCCCHGCWPRSPTSSRAERRFSEAATLLDEAADILHGLFTSASSPWVQSRLVSGMDDVFVARIRLEGARGANAERMYTAIEEARGRALLELLVNRPLATQGRSKELQDGERRISDLQRRLLQTTDRAERQRLLAQIFAAEEQTRPDASTAFFDRARRTGTRTGPSIEGIAVRAAA